MKAVGEIEIKETGEDEPFEVLRKANDVMRDVLRLKPKPPMFDAFWQTGETALLFGEPGVGKSLLAVQIADALARGTPLPGFVMPKRRRKVLYVDMNLSEEQFGRRYTAAASEGLKEAAYKFADRFYRMCPPHDKDLVTWVTKAVRLHGFDAVVIDDLTAIMRTNDGTIDSLKAVRGLKQLSHSTGVSMLVLADSLPGLRQHDMSECDLRRSRILCSVADSVFGIGQSSKDGQLDLIQFRTQTSEIVWGSKNKIHCAIQRNDSGLLGLVFDSRFQAEPDMDRYELITYIRQKRKEGVTYKEIADSCGISKTLAFKLDREWTPEKQELIDQQREFDDKPQEKNTENDDDDADFEDTDVRTGSDGCEQHWHDVCARTDWVSDDTDDDERRAKLPWYQRIDPHEHPFASGIRPLSIYDFESEFDEYGNELFVESRSKDTGKRQVWYSVCQRSRRTKRHHRTYHGTQTSTVSDTHWLPRRE
ncbi:MAG TPA: AAA family ATPase [Pyrinomonadaceae bacterium]|nr:AAA family ATPase [Pyrinomonadaceae bacterium]